ncbi:hypothetical protein D0Y83_05010 [Qipengyuania flava]|uniref:Uncharacterized protein n=1 Tax=Qipengyuania flava TaxID=192812 RepID=A0A5P6N9R9_9SPHN|nr:hypothetical protein D0Y83_05010 [Qipengyuania flava]
MQKKAREMSVIRLAVPADFDNCFAECMLFLMIGAGFFQTSTFRNIARVIGNRTIRYRPRFQG